VPASALILLEGTELMEGDKLVLLRNRSGQRFVILGKAADNAP
jgi:hypothetical protein